MTLEEIRSLIRDVPNFPKPGIVFKDITPLLADPAAFRATIDVLAERVAPLRADGILAIESRGFIFGAALAPAARTAAPARAQARQAAARSFSVELRARVRRRSSRDARGRACARGGRYLIVDDVIATGGTAAAVAKLVAQQRGQLRRACSCIELTFLNGRGRLAGQKIVSLISLLSAFSTSASG